MRIQKGPQDRRYLVCVRYDLWVTHGKQKWKSERSFCWFYEILLINRNVLLYKLLKYGITGILCYKSMYSDTKYRVRIYDKVSWQHLVSNSAAQWAQYWLIYTKMICMISSMTHAIRYNLVKFLSVVWADDLLLLSTVVKVSLAYKDV